MNLFGIWQLASSKNVKNNIIDLFNLCSMQVLSDGEWDCEFCGDKLKNKEDYRVHIQPFCTERPDWEHLCVFCGLEFESEPGLRVSLLQKYITNCKRHPSDLTDHHNMLYNNNKKYQKGPKKFKKPILFISFKEISFFNLSIVSI